jgi:hypothetical protein
MEFQDAKRALKVVYDHSDSDSSTDEHRKQLHIMYGGSWDITSKRSAPPQVDGDVHRLQHLQLPQEHGGSAQLLLVIFPTIANVRLYHTLIDGGAALNLNSLAAFQKLHISMSKLTPSCPVFRNGPDLHHPTR